MQNTLSWRNMAGAGKADEPGGLGQGRGPMAGAPPGPGGWPGTVGGGLLTRVGVSESAFSLPYQSHFHWGDNRPGHFAAGARGRRDRDRR